MDEKISPRGGTSLGSEHKRTVSVNNCIIIHNLGTGNINHASYSCHLH